MVRGPLAARSIALLRNGRLASVAIKFDRRLAPLAGPDATAGRRLRAEPKRLAEIAVELRGERILVRALLPARAEPGVRSANQKERSEMHLNWRRFRWGRAAWIRAGLLGPVRCRAAAVARGARLRPMDPPLLSVNRSAPPVPTTRRGDTIVVSLALASAAKDRAAGHVRRWRSGRRPRQALRREEHRFVLRACLCTRRGRLASLRQIRLALRCAGRRDAAGGQKLPCELPFFIHFLLKCTKKGASSAFSYENRRKRGKKPTWHLLREGHIKRELIDDDPCELSNEQLV